MSRYQDLDPNFYPHPLSGDLTVRTDVDAIKQSVKNLVSYNFYDKPFNPTVGSDILAHLFENTNSVTLKIMLERAIIAVLDNYEPRVTDVMVELTVGYDDIRAKIIFRAINTYQIYDVDVFLQRVR